MSIHAVTEFPALCHLTEHWRVLRDEALALNPAMLHIDRVGVTHDDVFRRVVEQARNGWIESWGAHKNRWLNYIYRFEERMCADAVGDQSHPMTARLLRRLGGIKVCALSRFLPQTFLPPHRHAELAAQGCLTYHLGLSVPDRWCFLHVDGQFVQHRSGEALVFDGSKPHFAFNMASEERLVLYIEFYRASALNKVDPLALMRVDPRGAQASVSARVD